MESYDSRDGMEGKAVAEGGRQGGREDTTMAAVCEEEERDSSSQAKSSPHLLLLRFFLKHATRAGGALLWYRYSPAHAPNRRYTSIGRKEGRKCLPGMRATDPIFTKVGKVFCTGAARRKVAEPTMSGVREREREEKGDFSR